MLKRLVQDPWLPLNREAIITSHHRVTWSELRRMTLSMAQRREALAHRRVGLSVEPFAASYAALAALDRLECDVFLLDATRPRAEILDLGSLLRLAAVAFPGAGEDGETLDVRELPGEAEWSGGSTVTVLTSGTTGTPKAVRHTWESLSRPVRISSPETASTWFLTYRPDLYAGLQVALQCFGNFGTLVLGGLGMAPQDAAALMVSARVQFVSGTPSYWRRMLLSCDRKSLKAIPLLQLTLGGEVVDQSVLNALKQVYPEARIVHIYATTELGRCFSVTDGAAGFPARFLNEVSADGVEMRIDEGELVVRSANAMQCYDPVCGVGQEARGWFHTGDLVKTVGDRVCFVGRKSETINVGGQKVHPIEVERVVREVPGVSDVRVFGKASSIVGQVVACDVVPQTGEDPDTLKQSVARYCRARLSPSQQPRIIRVVEEIDLSSSGKSIRSAAS